VTAIRYTPGRVIAVTLGLLAAGMGCGAVAGATALAVIAALAR